MNIPCESLLSRAGAAQLSQQHHPNSKVWAEGKNHPLLPNPKSQSFLCRIICRHQQILGVLLPAAGLNSLEVATSGGLIMYKVLASAEVWHAGLQLCCRDDPEVIVMAGFACSWGG